MSVVTLMVIVYIVGILGIVAMRKIQPENKIYPVWVVFVCIVLTAYVLCRVSQG